MNKVERNQPDWLNWVTESYYNNRQLVLVTDNKNPEKECIQEEIEELRRSMRFILSPFTAFKPENDITWHFGEITQIAENLTNKGMRVQFPPQIEIMAGHGKTIPLNDEKGRDFSLWINVPEYTYTRYLKICGQKRIDFP